jgi:hypothetical protein
LLRTGKQALRLAVIGVLRGDSHDGWRWFRYAGVVWWPVGGVGAGRL